MGARSSGLKVAAAPRFFLWAGAVMWREKDCFFNRIM